MSGALAALLDIDVGVVEKLIGEQFKGKDKLIAPNHAGAASRPRLRARRTSSARCGLRLERADAVGDRIFIDGNIAAALGCVYGGATVCAWYPITPSTSLAEAFDTHCQQYRASIPRPARTSFAIIQAEDETRLDRHGDRRRLERRARLHRDLGPRHLADAGIPRPRLFRRNPGGDLRRAARRARRPACRRAPSRPTSSPAPMPPMATPSMCCCSPKTRASASNSARAPSISPTGCRRRSSSCSISTSA